MPNPFSGGMMNRASKGMYKAKNRKKTILRLTKYLAPYSFWFILCIIFTIFASALELIGPFLSGEAIDIIADAELNLTKINLNDIIKIIILMLIIYTLSSIINYLTSMIMVKISKKVVYQMRKDAFNSLMNAPITYFDKRSIGDIISVVSYDIDTVNTSLTSDVIQIITSFFTVVFSFIMMLIIKPVLVLIFVITIPLCLISSKKLIKKTRILYSKRSYELGRLNGYAEEAISANKDIKTYNNEKSVMQKYRLLNNEATNAYYKAEYYGCYMGPLVNFFNNLSLSLVCIFGALLNIFSGFSYGSIAKFVQYSRKFSGPINETANIFTDLQSSLSAAERVFELIDIEQEKKDKLDAKHLVNAQGNFIFNDVNFSYEKNRPVIKNFNLTIHQGEQIALVGETGCGKTTLISLLMRFYDLDSGQIILDNEDINNYYRNNLRSNFAMVLQDTWLFEGTVYENLTYGNDKVIFEEVVQACKDSYIHDFIMSLKDGYDTILKEGGINISKGQKQLLTIARAMLLKANILILDEATSNVDTRIEKHLQEAMKTLMKNKTCFVIAHRLSTIVNANKIVVMNDGKIIESGNHQQLMEQKGYYYNLFNSQFK